MLRIAGYLILASAVVGLLAASDANLGKFQTTGKSVANGAKQKPQSPPSQ